MNNARTKLPQRLFDSFRTPSCANKIIVRIDKKEIKTNSGIKLDYNDDVIYAEGIDSHAADVSTVMGTVVKVPDSLYFHPRDVNSMSWEVDGFDLQVNYQVWSHPLNVRNCDEIDVDGELYQVWSAEDVFIAKKPDGEVVCLNGNVILEPMYKERLSEFDLLPKELDKERAIVRFVGKPNKRYQAVQCADLHGIKPGDEVIIEKGTPIIWLERFSYNTNFDNGKMYYCLQARHLVAKI